jgi:hypothetical protein
MRSLLVLALVALPAHGFPVPKPSRTRDVAGTVWKGPIQWTNHQLLEQTITFHGGGKVHMCYKEHPGTNYNGTWKQDGAKLTFNFGSDSSYEATLDGDEWTGTAENSSKMTATHKAKLEPPK